MTIKAWTWTVLILIEGFPAKNRLTTPYFFAVEENGVVQIFWAEDNYLEDAITIFCVITRDLTE